MLVLSVKNAAPPIFAWDLSETLNEYCAEIDATARWQIDFILPHLAESAGANEELRANDPKKRVGLMNTCKAQAEEVVFAERIYD